MNAAAHALAWTLMHFLWEGTLIAAGLLFAFRFAGPASARLRYGLASLALLAMLGAFGLTFWQLWPDGPALAGGGPLPARAPHSALPGASTLPLPEPDARFLWLAALWML